MRIIFFTFLFINFLFSQKNFKRAEDSYNKMNYTNVIKELLMSNDKNQVLTVKQYEILALSYFHLCDYQNAKKWFDKLYESKRESLDEKLFIKYLASLRSNRDYDVSILKLKDFYKFNNDRLYWFANQNKKLDSILKQEERYNLFNINSNTKYAEFGVVRFGDYLVFSASRDTSSIVSKRYIWNDQPFLKLYRTEFNASNGDFLNPSLLFNDFFKDKGSFHNASIAVCPSNKYIYFTRNNVNSKFKPVRDNYNNSNLQIVRAEVSENKIVKEEVLPFNSDEYSCGQPSLSSDGRLLFFVSNMPGSIGETDIYYVEVFNDGTTNSPKNLGSKINTLGREMFPNYQDGVLYFSSDGHLGLGGLDIFKVELKDFKEIGEPVNMGNVVNSNKDDFGFLLLNNTSGYFSSNRLGGKGDDDIYFFKEKEVLKINNLVVSVLEESTNIPIDSVNINVTDFFGSNLVNTTTNLNGEFHVDLLQNQQYELSFIKNGYGNKKIIYNSPLSDTNPLNSNLTIYMPKLANLTKVEEGLTKILVNPIYFEYNKWDITPLALVELNKVLKVMNDFPEVKIRIESHTDSRGNDKYNLRLSQQRANSTKQFLLDNGIHPDRIIQAVGFGETKIKNHCFNNVKCSDEDHLINRRSDFIIVD
jgi:outer membrane protein OmpA-like peptidoglycan-associated protein